MFEQFHFIQPLWLLALLPLAVLLWRISRQGDTNNPWRRIVDARLLPLLMSRQAAGKNTFPLWLLAGGWLVAVLALADPSWEQLPQPVLQTSTSRVIVLDLSRSMLAADLQPSRLVRARFKVEDILAHDNEGQTGLVVFAGDAFSVTPLTRDVDTIRAQLKALEPDIMPSQGSRADLGLDKAKELLQLAGVTSGQVILIADGIEGDKAIRAASRLRQSGFSVSVLGVGTAAGAPLPDGRGGVIEDASGKPVLVKLDSQALQAVAQAGSGRYSLISGNASDIDYLLDAATGQTGNRQDSDLQTQQWKQQGPLLAALLLPLAALAFRRGWLLSMLFCSVMLAHPQPAMAFNWNDLWKRTDQQAAEALQQGHYEQAARLAEDPAQRGSAEYKKGDYKQALDAFRQAPGADAAYNRGNALAQQGTYEQAIAAYDEALDMQPDMEDAAANKAAVEALLQKQQQQQQDQQQQSGQQGQQDQQQQSGQQGQQDQQQQGQPGQQGEQNQQANSDESSTGTGDTAGQAQSAKEDASEPAQDEHKTTSAGEQPSSDEQAADGDDGGQQKNAADNAFAKANRQLDEGKTGQRDDELPADTGNEADARESAGEDEQPADSTHSTAEAEALSSEEQLAARQWLRRIPDDPGGLLRRKFLYQYRQRAHESDNTQNW